MTDEAWDTIDNVNPPEAYRYTDADVRVNTRMYRQVALDYLERYAGEFELLLSYRRRVDAGGMLTVPMIRAILNCMRFDGAEDELPPRPARAPANVVNIKTRRPVKRPRYVKLRTTWRKTCSISSWVTASRIHRVHPNSHFEYDTETGEFRCRLWWMCKPDWDHPRFPFELLTFGEAYDVIATHPGWLFCRKCFEGVGA